MGCVETVILKFGGASVATTEQFSGVADIILDRSRSARVIAVVSAMEGMTNQLLALAQKVHPEPPPREQDMLVSVGERISMALLAMALHFKGWEAVSFTGSQAGIVTSSKHSDAEIIDIKTPRIREALDTGKVVIVAGFQGVSRNGEITTLGRGGSDISAVALGIAHGASKVEFFKDVEGVYSHDPKACADATLFSHLSFDQAADIMDGGCKVLHPRCVRLAAKNNLPMRVLSFYDPAMQIHPGTWIGPQVRGELNSCIYEGNS